MLKRYDHSNEIYNAMRDILTPPACSNLGRIVQSLRYPSDATFSQVISYTVSSRMSTTTLATSWKVKNAWHDKQNWTWRERERERGGGGGGGEMRVLNQTDHRTYPQPEMYSYPGQKNWDNRTRTWHRRMICQACMRLIWLACLSQFFGQGSTNTSFTLWRQNE